MRWNSFPSLHQVSEFFWGLEHQTNKIPTKPNTWTTHIISSCLRFLYPQMNLYGDRTRGDEKVGGGRDIRLSQYHVCAVALNLCSSSFFCFLTFEFFFIFGNKWFFRNVFCKHFLIFWFVFFISPLNNVFHCSLFHWAEVLNFNEVHLSK